MSAHETKAGEIVLTCDTCLFATTQPFAASRGCWSVGWKPLDQLGEEHECPECRLVGVSSRHVGDVAEFE